MSIHVTWIGEGAEPHGLIGDAIRVLGREYGRPVARVSLGGRPPDTYEPSRRQHSSRGMLSWLAGHEDVTGARLLGVTDVDLFIPVLTFVFGEAQLGGRVAVVSISRLRDGGIPAVLTARLATEAVHEIGHTFGLVHCTSAACVMARSPGLTAVDRKTDRLCADCRVRYQQLREQPYVATHPPHPHR